MATRFRGLDNWYSGNIRFSETVVKPGIPSHNKFDYPMDELRNGKNTKKMITAIVSGMRYSQNYVTTDFFLFIRSLSGHHNPYIERHSWRKTKDQHPIMSDRRE